jgi:hypothetical protein
MQHTWVATYKLKVCVGKFKERVILVGLGVDGTVTFIWISENKTIDFS